MLEKKRGKKKFIFFSIYLLGVIKRVDDDDDEESNKGNAFSGSNGISFHLSKKSRMSTLAGILKPAAQACPPPFFSTIAQILAQFA